jgi:hypothetical protein
MKSFRTIFAKGEGDMIRIPGSVVCVGRFRGQGEVTTVGNAMHLQRWEDWSSTEDK